MMATEIGYVSSSTSSQGVHGSMQIFSSRFLLNLADWLRMGTWDSGLPPSPLPASAAAGLKAKPRNLPPTPGILIIQIWGLLL